MQQDTKTSVKICHRSLKKSPICRRGSTVEVWQMTGLGDTEDLNHDLNQTQFIDI
jgi:hypothetical protein